MSETALRGVNAPLKIRSGNWRERTARRLVQAQLKRIDGDLVHLHEARELYQFGTASAAALSVDVKVKDPRFYRRVLADGGVGAAEAYMEDLWECSDLTALCRIVLRSEMQQQVAGRKGRLGELLDGIIHALKRNSLRGARRNIAAHYDLGNDFFRLFLDDNLMYSCAIFPYAESTLEEASDYKVDRICRKLDLGPQDHLLEIGTGWGGFAIHAARQYGCRVTTTTISQHQWELARQRVADAGLQDRVEVLLEDYRDLRGQYDKLVSIEMIEAVGHHYLDTYFRRCGELLKAEGLMLLQAICISDWVYQGALRRVDFIKKYIFPGSFMPCVGAIADSVKRMTDMKIVHLEDIGEHYARTLRIWRQRFVERLDSVREMGYSEEFIRMWEFYLCYCEASFAERYNSDAQILLGKPGNRRDLILPPLT